MIVAVHERGRALGRDAGRQQPAQLAGPRCQLFGRALHEHRPAHHLGDQGHWLLVADAALLDRQGVEPLENAHRRGRYLFRLLTLACLLDSQSLDRFHEDEWPSVHHRLGAHIRNGGGRDAYGMQRRHDSCLANHVSGRRDPRARRR